MFVTFDGPKGSGKSTLLAAVAGRLRAEGKEVAVLEEKSLDPRRSQIRGLLRASGEHLPADLDRAVIELLMESRAEIGQRILSTQAAIILMDRWTASDAVFRLHVPFTEVLAAAGARGVREPDLVVATLCPAEVSWSRAHARDKGLDSSVIRSYEQHSLSCAQFESIAREQGWFLVRTDCPVDVAARAVCARLGSVAFITG